MPMSSYQGEYLHADLFDQAAAYAYHLCENHPFIDGNKRAALATALVFLELNGVRLDDPEEELYELMMSVAKGETRKPEIARTLRKLAQPEDTV